MIQSYLTIIFRNLIRKKVYSMLTIIVLAIGLTTVLVIFLYVHYELSFDRFHENADRIYRVVLETPYAYKGKNKSPVVPAPLAQTMVNDFPEVVTAVRLQKNNRILLSSKEKSFVEDELFFADPEIFDVFSLELLQGDTRTALADPFSIILSETTAKRYFGNKDPMGEIISYGETYDFKVSGILQDMPSNSHFHMNGIVPIDVAPVIRPFIRLDSWEQSSFYTYFLLSESNRIDDLGQQMPAFVKKYLGEDFSEQYKIHFQPLTKIHLHSDLMSELSINGNTKSIYILTSVALLILLMACINYMNLATARSTQRYKEVGIRKIVGARKKQIIQQFLTESTLLTILALLAAIIFANLMLPTFNVFIQKKLQLNVLLTGKYLLALIVCIILVSLSAGGYPALAMSSFRSLSLISGSLARTGRSTLRMVLVIIQFTISIGLLVCSFVIKEQLDFILNKDVGYQKDQIVVIQMWDKAIRKNIDIVKNTLQKNPGILSVSSSAYLPNETSGLTMADWPGKPDNVKLDMYMNWVDYDFIDLYGIEIVEGRNFSKTFVTDHSGAVLLNESAVEAIGWNNPVGKEVFLPSHGTDKRTAAVVGVMKDFHMQSLHLPIQPLFVILDPERADTYLSAKINSAHIPETISHIRETMGQYSPKYPFVYNFFDDIFDQTYSAEHTLRTIFAVFAFITILIACLGQFGLALYITDSRTKEIGIRKVLGASVLGIVQLLTHEFSKCIMWANIISWPIAWYVMNKWLQVFAYRIDLNIRIFLTAGTIALFIALLTVSSHTLKAAMSHPSDSLRHE